MKLKKTKSKDVRIEMVGMPDQKPAPAEQERQKKTISPPPVRNPEVAEPATRDKGLKGVAFTVDFDVKP